MGVKAPRAPVMHCVCSIIKPGQNTADPDSFRKCRERASRFVNTTNGRVFLCAGHFQSHMLVGSGQDVEVFSRAKPRRRNT